MNVTSTSIEGLVIIEPKIFGDERGYFLESYHEKKYQEAGIVTSFVQDNHSLSKKGILRGLHMQVRKPQAKLVRVTEGAVVDVAVDLRADSPTFGQYEAVILSADNFLQFYIPAGFAHGFYVLSERAQFQYKCSEFYDPSDEITLQWDDKEIAVDWQLTDEPILSDKDRQGYSFSEIKKRLAS